MLSMLKNEVEKQNRWDKHFLQMCLDHARMSKDPSTKCGAVIVGEDNEILSVGYNGFPRGIEDSYERLNVRKRKLELTLHAEVNAILSSARTSLSTKGKKMYVLCTTLTMPTMSQLVSSKSNDVPVEIIWGGPCINCALHIIQAGITELITARRGDVPDRWKPIMDEAQFLLKEGGVQYRVVPESVF